MARTATKPEAVKTRGDWARDLLERQVKVAPDLLKIDEAKDALRALCEEASEGFTEEVPGLGSIEVKAGTEAKFKGLMPELVPEAYLALTEGRQKKLIDAGLVVLTNLMSKESKPSVTVRL